MPPFGHFRTAGLPRSAPWPRRPGCVGRSVRRAAGSRLAG